MNSNWPKEYFLRLLNQLPSNGPLHIDLYDDLANLTSQMQDFYMSVEWQKQLITFKKQNRFSVSIMSKGKLKCCSNF